MENQIFSRGKHTPTKGRDNIKRCHNSKKNKRDNIERKYYQ